MPSATGAEAASFTRLVAAHQQTLYRYALRRLRDEQDALDCTQEVLLAAWRARSARRDPRVPDRAWLLRIMQRKQIDHTRRRARHARCASALDEQTLALAAREQPTTALGDREAATCALAALSPPLRAVAVARLVHDLSEAQTAAALGVPLNTVKSRLYRARRTLAAALTD
jgi:RNA polymerase sigma-70 factor (ECF subfamily)